MKSSAYWQKRFEQLEEASNAYGVATYRQIEPAFELAQRQIDREIEAWYGRFATNNEISLQEARKMLSASELKEFHWDVKEYIKYGQENAIDGLWVKELENASTKFHISRLEALKVRTQQAIEVAFGNELDAVDGMARRIFTDGYYHSIFEMQKGIGLGWEIGQIDERTLDKIIKKPWAADGKNFSDRIWQSRSQLINEVHNELIRNCVLGKAPDEAIRHIAKKFDTSKSQAGRLIMTESSYFHSVAQEEAFKELGVEEYEILATLDSDTSNICRSLDGKVFPMDEYSPGSTAPPFHPWCRSVTIPHFNDNYGGERAARDETGNTYYVPDNLTYTQWEKQFVKDNLVNIDGVDYHVLKFKQSPEGRKEYEAYIHDALDDLDITDKEHHELWKRDGGYIQNSQGYKDINGVMRGLKPSLDNPNCQSAMDALIDTTSRNTLFDNFIGYRKLNISFLDEVMGVPIDVPSLVKTKGRIEMFKSKASAEKVADAIRGIIGTKQAIITDSAVTSVSLCENLNAFSNRVFGLEIELPKGTKGLLTDNIPESEFIAMPDSSLEIYDVKVYTINDRWGKRPGVKMYARIIQKGG